MTPGGCSAREQLNPGSFQLHLVGGAQHNDGPYGPDPAVSPSPHQDSYPCPANTSFHPTLPSIATPRPSIPPCHRGVMAHPEHCRLHNCIIISDSWPSWLFICGAHHLECHSIFLPTLDLPWLPALQKLFPSCRWVQLTPQSLTEILLNDIQVVLIQGHFYLSPDDLPICLEGRAVLWSVPPSIGHFSTSKGYQVTVSHRATGGVLHGDWSFWSTHPISLPSPAPCQRRLRHLINPGSPHDQPGQTATTVENRLRV
jgi:hypothetical protein